MVIRAYSYRLYPNAVQVQAFAQHFGSVRFVYNWALEAKSKAYTERGERVSLFALTNQLPTLKQQYPWLLTVNAQSLQMALRNLDTAFTAFFRKDADFPTFNRKRGRQSFQCPQACTIDWERGTLSLPKIKHIKTVLHRPFEGTLKTVTISKTPTGKYFASVVVEEAGDDPAPAPIQEATTLGIDVGLNHLLVLSDGTKVDNPRHLKQSAKKLARAQKRLSRKQKGSNRRNKQRVRVARLHEKVANQRKDMLHKTTHTLTRKNHATTFCVETLAVKNLLKNHNLARAIADAAWGTFYQFLAYKCERTGKNLIAIGRFEPSSKLCSVCGAIQQDMPLTVRVWTCGNCGSTHDRDVNAAQNIKRFGLLKSTAGSAGTDTLREFG